MPNGAHIWSMGAALMRALTLSFSSSVTKISGHGRARHRDLEEMAAPRSPLRDLQAALSAGVSTVRQTIGWGFERIWIQAGRMKMGDRRDVSQFFFGRHEG